MKFLKKVGAWFWLAVYTRTGSLKALGRYRTLAHIVRQPGKRFTVLDLQKADLATSLWRGARVGHVINTVVTKPVKIDLIGDQQYLVNEPALCVVHEGRVDNGNGLWSTPVVTPAK